MDVQQSFFEMHMVWPIAVHAVSPLGHSHVPPGMGQISPVTVQSFMSQQVPVGMHVLPLMQGVWPVPQFKPQ